MAVENLDSPDQAAMATTQATQETPDQIFKRLKIEEPKASPPPPESPEQTFRRLGIVTPTPANPADLQQSALLGTKVPKDRAARILEAQRDSVARHDADYVSRNLEQVEDENRRDTFLKKVSEDFSDMGPGASPPSSAAWSTARILSEDPLKASAFSGPGDVDALKRTELALAAARSPEGSLRPLTPKEVQEQAERWADQRLGSWLTTPMQIGVSPEELRSNTVQMALEEIRRQEEYIAGAGKAGFLETGKRIHEENPWWFAPFFNMVEPISHSIDVSMAKDRIAAGQGSLADIEFLERERRYAVAKVMRGEDFGGKFAELASALPAFIGAAGITKPLAQGVEQFALRKGAGLAANYLANPQVLGAVASTAKLAGITSQMLTAGGPSLFNDYLERQSNGDPKAIALTKATLAGLINWGSLHIPMNPIAKMMAAETGAIPTTEALVQRMTQDLTKKTLVGTVEGSLGFLGTNEITKLMSHVAGVGEYHLPEPTDALAQLILGGALGFGHSYVEGRNDLRNAEAVRDYLKDAEKALQDLSVKASAPGTVADTVKEIAGDHDVRMAHVDAGEFRDYFQAQNPNDKEHPFKLADELTGKKGALADAILDGQKLQIPLEAYLSDKMKPEDRAHFADKVKLDPMAPSVEEAQSHLDQLTKELETERKAQQEKQKLLTGQQPVPDYPTMIGKRIREQMEAGGWTKEAASVEALVRAGFTRLQEYAKQSGVDPYEFLKKYEPTLNTEVPGAPVEGSNYVRVLDQSGASHIEQVRGSTPLEMLENAQSAWPDSSFEPMTKEEVEHYLKIAMERPEHTITLEQPEQPAFEKKTPEGPRGRIRIGEGSVNIDLLKTADSSTFVHELGHLYLEALGDLATRETDRSSITVKKDFQTILEWLGVKDRSEIGTDQHEQFARGFERYLMEGEAPTGRLRQVFSKFRDWLVGIYKDVRNLNVDLSPKVREVFDRLLASDEQIEKAKERAAEGDDFVDAPGLELSPRDRARLQELVDARDAAAKAVVDAKALRDIKQQQTKQWQHARDMMEEQVRAELNQRPEMIALSLLQKGEMPNGEKLPEGITFKLDRNAIPKLFGDQYSGIDLKALPRGITTKEGGIHPDLAAELLGFKSGKELIQALQGLDYEGTVQRETDARMEQQVEKPLETLDEEARKAIHNDKQAEIKAFGLKWLAENKLKQHNDLVRLITNPTKYLKQVRDYVAQKVADIPQGEIDPSIYEAGEKDCRKKARDAALSGDYVSAFRWRDKEILNHEFFRAATDAKDEMQEGIPKFDRFDQADEKLAKSRDMNYVSTGRAVKAAFGLGSSDKAPDDYLKQIKAYAPETYPAVKDLVDNAIRDAVPVDQMTYGQYKDLKQTLDALWEESRNSRTIEVGGKIVEKETAIGELTPRIQELGQAFKGQGSKEAISENRKATMMLLGVKAAVRRVESWCEQVGQVAKKYISDPIFQATAEYREARKENLKGYKDDVRLLDPESFKPRKIEAPELGYTFSGKGEILAAILHSGNDSNLGKLLVGRGWGVRDENGTLDTSKWDTFRDRMIKEGVITKADYDFSQRVWDRFDALKGPAQRAHRDMYGFYFNEITKKEVQTPWGTYEGGYAPAQIDPWVYRDQKANEERESLLKNDNSFMFPTTGRGMTKNRAESFAAPLLLSLDLLPGQFDKVLRFTHIEPAVKSVGKLLFDKEFRKTLDAYDPAVVDDMLIPWLQRTAQQSATTPSKGLAGKALDAVARWTRTSTGMQMMVANVENALEQTTGLFSTKLQTDGIAKALWDYKSDPAAFSQNIAEKSIYMRNRSGVQEMELRKSIEDMITFPSQWTKLKDFTDAHGYFLQEGIQNIVDKLTWHAAYNEAVEGGKMTDAEAVLHADSVVRQTQFSSNPEDTARIEAGPPALRMFTMFMSHWNRQLNLLYTEHMKAGELDGRGAQAMRRAFVWFTGFVMPAIVSQAISKTLRPDEGNDEDGPAMAMGKFFFGALGSNAVSLVPAVGPLAESILFGHGDKFGSSPAIESVKRAGHSVVSVPKAVVGEGKPGTAVRDVLTLVGMLTKTPAAALGRPLGYIADVMHGDVEANNPVQIIRGLMTGHGEARK